MSLVTRELVWSEDDLFRMVQGKTLNINAPVFISTYILRWGQEPRIGSSTVFQGFAPSKGDKGRMVLQTPLSKCCLHALLIGQCKLCGYTTLPVVTLEANKNGFEEVYKVGDVIGAGKLEVIVPVGVAGHIPEKDSRGLAESIRSCPFP